jgi:CubicO group peptidase (beta-lactamase class C family)
MSPLEAGKMCREWYSKSRCRGVNGTPQTASAAFEVPSASARNKHVLSFSPREGGSVARTLISSVCLLLVLSVPMHRGAETQRSGSSMEKGIDAIFSGVTSPEEPGLAVLARQNGKTVFSRGYGVRDLRTKAKIDPFSNFRLASFTKQFTAMAIMLLVHDGKLRYQETLAEIFPDFPEYGKTITVGNLLHHVSGLPDYEALMEQVEKAHGPLWSREKQIQDGEVLELLKKEKSGKFAPGASWSYSNSGYVVLGLIVAKTSGQSYGEFLRERIFAPLKMNHTIVYQKEKNEVANRAFGHSKEDDTFKETDQSSTSATLGDGGIYSNLKDLAKWDDALRNHTLLSEKEFQAALTPVKLNDGCEPHWPKEPNGDNLHPLEPVSYGFGWFLDPYHGHTRMWHTGSTMGFRTVIERFLDENLTIIILSNRTDLEPEKLSLQVADLFLSAKN